jgi:hypothetical protein
VTKWFYASAQDSEPKVQEAREIFAHVAHRWFAKQADWLKDVVLSVGSAVTILTNRDRYERLKKYKADPNDPPTPLLKCTVDLLAERFGAPTVEQVKVIGWHVNDRLDLIVQKDQNWGTYIWMTWPFPDLILNPLCEIYVAGRGRHSGTYLLPTLGRGRAALKMKIAKPWNIQEAMALIDVAVAQTQGERQQA